MLPVASNNAEGFTVLGHFLNGVTHPCLEGQTAIWAGLNINYFQEFWRIFQW